jgi:ADP-heptose:LPS heptosyltransferase
MGDLVQTLPLITSLAERCSLTLICDKATEDWAALLQGIAEIVPIDTQHWRKLSSGGNLPLVQLLEMLNNDFHHISSGDLEKYYPLNDHDLSNILAALACHQDSEKWLSCKLVLARSYLRTIAPDRRWNRVHLADLWRYLQDNAAVASIPAVKSSSSGIQFAETMLQPFHQAGIQRIWGFILGSGGKYRRLNPEYFTDLWNNIPTSADSGLVLIGGKGEEALAEKFLECLHPDAPAVINLVGQCSPEQLLGLLSQIDLVVGVDTGPLHWAAAAGAKVAGFYFGDAGYCDTGPYGSGHYVLSPDCEYYPCHPQRATDCEYQCRQNYSDTNAISKILADIGGDDPNVMFRAPEGLSISRSVVHDDGVRYERSDGHLLKSEIRQFETLARSLLSQTSGKKMELEGSAAVMADRWQEEIRNLPLPRIIPAAMQEKVRSDALELFRDKQKVSFSRPDVKIVEGNQPCVSCF